MSRQSPPCRYPSGRVRPDREHCSRQECAAPRRCHEAAAEKGPGDPRDVRRRSAVAGSLSTDVGPRFCSDQGRQDGPLVVQGLACVSKVHVLPPWWIQPRIRIALGRSNVNRITGRHSGLAQGAVTYELARRASSGVCWRNRGNSYRLESRCGRQHACGAWPRRSATTACSCLRACMRVVISRTIARHRDLAVPVDRPARQ
jgi:hypothetical protein